MSSQYREDAKKGIDSPGLQASLHGLQDRFGKGAMALWAAMDDKDMRKRVKKSRMKNFEHLDIVLAELAQNVRARGGNIYFAETAQDAIDYTLEVAGKNEVKRVVKGKSMISMEIGIDRLWKRRGLRWSKPTWENISFSWQAKHLLISSRRASI